MFYNINPEVSQEAFKLTSVVKLKDGKLLSLKRRNNPGEN